MARVRIRTSSAELIEGVVSRPYDSRAEILMLRRQRKIGRSEARSRWDEAVPIAMLDSMSRVVLRRGVKKAGGGYVDVSHAQREWQDVVQQAAVTALERGGELQAGMHMGKAVNAAAYKIAFDRGGLTKTRRHRGAAAQVEFERGELEIESDAWSNEVDQSLDVRRFLARLTPRRRLVVLKRMAGERLTRAESMVLLRLRRSGDLQWMLQ